MGSVYEQAAAAPPPPYIHILDFYFFKCIFHPQLLQ
jgi:hypothetical protein